MSTTTPLPLPLPNKVYLRRKEVEAAVGGRRQLDLLEKTGQLRGVRLPGYDRKHYARATVQIVLVRLFGS